MLIQPNDIAILEKYDAMVSAPAAAETPNGIVGKIDGTTGKFAAAAAGDCFAWTKEVGHFDEDFAVPTGGDVRVVLMSEINGRLVKITPDCLASGDFVVGGKYASNANGKLVSGASDAPYFEVVELINFGGKGARAKIVAE